MASFGLLEGTRSLASEDLATRATKLLKFIEPHADRYKNLVIDHVSIQHCFVRHFEQGMLLSGRSAMLVEMQKSFCGTAPFLYPVCMSAV